MFCVWRCFLSVAIVFAGILITKVRTEDNYKEFSIFQPHYSNLPKEESYAYSVGERKKTFTVYWNVPTFMCHRHGIMFNLSEFGIRQNAGDEFRGSTNIIMYDPGVFPALLKSEKIQGNITLTARNGGVPQIGNLTMHLEKFKADLEEIIPEKTFSGIAVIDFEYWRPIWRQNWDSLDIYRQLSREVEKTNHPDWTNDRIEKEASLNFEKYARIFMEDTLKLARKLRPNGRWGYYAFPYCFNYDLKPSCDKVVMKDNDKIHWLFEASSATFSSIYLNKQGEGNKGFMTGGVAEAERVVANISTPVYPYVNHKYRYLPDHLSKDDTLNSLAIPKSLEADGAIIWGSSNDVNTKMKCESLLNYVQTVLGPIAKQLSG